MHVVGKGVLLREPSFDVRLPRSGPELPGDELVEKRRKRYLPTGRAVELLVVMVIRDDHVAGVADDVNDLGITVLEGLVAPQQSRTQVADRFRLSDDLNPVGLAGPIH